MSLLAECVERIEKERKGWAPSTLVYVEFIMAIRRLRSNSTLKEFGRKEETINGWKEGEKERR
jgi:hypothetical protein